MSLFGSLFTGVSALSAQSQSIGMISTNIANVNTVGYKRDAALFSSLVTSAGRNAAYSPGGVRAVTVSSIKQQGILQQSASTTDAAISGNGFFVVQREPTYGVNNEKMFTRAGSFAEDASGLLRNANGFYLMGWPLTNGAIPANSSDISSLRPVDVSAAGAISSPTTEMQPALNLNASEPAGSTYTRTVTVYDALGVSHSLRLNFTKEAVDPLAVPPTGPNSWNLVVNGAPNWGGARNFQVDFDPATGEILQSFDLDSATPAVPVAGNLMNMTINWNDLYTGAADSTIAMDLSGMIQFNKDYGGVVEQNGAELALRTGVVIDEDGFVAATYSNGRTQNLYKLPISTFANANGLTSRSGNVFSQSQESGAYNLNQAKAGGAGTIVASALEASNVDLADEFSKMIVTQRAYSAGTKTITTADQMLEELLRMR